MSKKPLIEKVPSLPRSMRERVTVYDDIIKKVEQSEKGYYKITLAGKKATTILAALSKRVRTKKDTLKLYMRNKEVYLERL